MHSSGVAAQIGANPGFPAKAVASSIRSVFARLRSFAFNILKANRTGTLSQDRYRAGLIGIKDLLKMLAVSQR